MVYEAEDFGVHGFEPWEKPARVALKVRHFCGTA